MATATARILLIVMVCQHNKPQGSKVSDSSYVSYYLGEYMIIRYLDL